MWPDLLLSCTKLSQCILNVLRHIGLEHRTRVHRLGHRHLPRLQQAFHTLAGALIHDKIRLHEGLVQIPANIDGIWGSDILDNGIEHVEGWKLIFRACLHHVSHQYKRHKRKKRKVRWMGDGVRTYRTNMLVEFVGYGFRILCILFGDES